MVEEKKQFEKTVEITPDEVKNIMDDEFGLSIKLKDFISRSF